MKALWFDGKKLFLKNLAVPRPGKNEALVKIKFAGICNTDLEILKGYMRFVGVPGHEFVGVVEKGPRTWIGKRVVGEINLACGKCGYCQAGQTHHCPSRTVLGIAGKQGVFSEYVTLPVGNLHQVPTAIPDLEAVFVEPLAAAARILEQVPILKDSKVILLGDGKLGQLIARVVRLKTENLLMVGNQPSKLALAQRLGIKTALASKLKKLKPDDKPLLVIEATGSPAGFHRALELCRPEGTIILKSTFAGAPAMNLSPLVVDEIKIVGSRCGNFSPALKLLAAGSIDLRGLTTGIFALEDYRAAFACAKAPKSFKVIFKI